MRADAEALDEARGEMRAASKKLIVELVASAVIACGTTALAIFAEDKPAPKPAVTTPLCVGEIETTLASGERARVSSLRRCAAPMPDAASTNIGPAPDSPP